MRTCDRQGCTVATPCVALCAPALPSGGRAAEHSPQRLPQRPELLSPIWVPSTPGATPFELVMLPTPKSCAPSPEVPNAPNAPAPAQLVLAVALAYPGWLP